MKTILHRSFEAFTNDSLKMRVHGPSLFGIAVLALLVLTSCALSMVGPSEWGPVVDKTKPVQFVGGAGGVPPNTLITIQAYDPVTMNWFDLPGGETTSQEWRGMNGDLPPSYWWGTWLVIPSQYWAEGQECASTGESALVRSKWSGGILPSVTNDWVSCYVNDPVGFPSNCLSPKSPNVRVGSLNYHDFGKECGDFINHIRAVENNYWKSQPVNRFGEILPLQIYETGECEADCHAKCNYDWELEHPDDAHRCKPWEQHQCNFPITHGAAQNECQVYSFDGILVDCIWNDIYQHEKTNYINDPDNCRNKDWPDGCGHYLNMLTTSLTKVSCGLYEFTNQWGQRKYKSVQNFLP
jgi:hypothetical protein